MTSALAADRDARREPDPLEWSPVYRDQPWLYDWLEGDSALPSDMVRVPRPRPFQPLLNPESPSLGDLRPIETFDLQRRRAAAPAPYVGDPFIYVWWYASDQFGNSVAARAHIHHIEDRRERIPPAGPDVPDVVSALGPQGQLRWFNRFRRWLAPQPYAVWSEFYCSSDKHKGMCCSSCASDEEYEGYPNFDDLCCCYGVNLDGDT